MGQKQTLGNDCLLRRGSRLFDQCCHLARVQKKNSVGAGEFDRLGLRPLRHETLQVRIDHPVLFRDHGIARLILPARDCDLRVQGFRELLR
jgi:hypothetical protein